MPLKTHVDEQPTMNLVSMIDVVLLLLIFFMVGTKFAEMERNVDLEVPEVADAGALTSAPARRVINVFRDGHCTLDGEDVAGLDDLTGRLARAREQYADLGVVVRGDGSGPFQYVAEVLNACKQAGIAELAIAVRLAEAPQVNRMDASTFDRWLAALTDPHFLRWVLWGGFAVITLSLMVLMRTRWGQAQPLRKCVILSLVAHLLLACYSTTVHINAQTASLSRPRTAIMRVTEVAGLADGNDEDDEPATEESGAGVALRPWEAFSTDRTTEPQGFELERPAGLEVAAPTRRETLPAAPWETQPALPDAAPGELQLPQPENVPVDDVAAAPDTARSAEPIEAPQASRRDVEETLPDDVPGPQPATSAAAAGSQPFRRATSDEVPAELLEPPGLPPTTLDPPTVAAPASALSGVDDDPRTFSGGPVDLNATTAGSSGASGLPEGGAADGAGASRGSGDGNVDSIVHRSGGGGQSPDELLNPQPQVGPARANQRRERSGAHGLPEIYTARTAPNRGDIAETRGGTGETEGAVQGALGWLAANQSADGRWDASRHGAGQQSRGDGQNAGRTRALAGVGAQADTGLTGLALLAFLGAGHTHHDGTHADNVRRGLEFLVASQASDGSLAGGAELYAAMYCHGMAACALSEAYGMTADPALEEPLRKAIAYTLAAQHPTNGGWRYQRGDSQGDTSQLGWQLMALKSAELAGIGIPSRSRAGMERFLQSVAAGQQGGLARYRPNEQTNRTMTAEALVCRQFLGIADADASAEAADFILQELPGAGVDNYYYWYYATLATFHLQGDAWRQWNQALRDTLVAHQRLDGAESGSWDPDPVWGSYGGRVYSTALGALSLEVYYRYLPLYAGHGK